MRKLIVLTMLVCSLFSVSAMARDTTLHLSLSDAMARSDYQERLGGEVQFFLSGQPYATPAERMGEFITNKKTNAFGKSDVEACEWVMLSALIALQERALAEGGNAVVDIVSYYKRNEFVSAAEYECHAGAIMAGVALKGRIVTLP